MGVPVGVPGVALTAGEAVGVIPGLGAAVGVGGLGVGVGGTGVAVGFGGTGVAVGFGGIGVGCGRTGVGMGYTCVGCGCTGAEVVGETGAAGVLCGPGLPVAGRVAVMEGAVELGKFPLPGGCKLKMVISKSRKIRPNRRIEPNSQRRISIWPGRTSHQRTRSRRVKRWRGCLSGGRETKKRECHDPVELKLGRHEALSTATSRVFDRIGFAVFEGTPTGSGSVSISSIDEGRIG